MFLAVRELRHSRLRYLLIGAVIALIAWLVFLLSGLANGLSNDNAAALMHMPADHLVFQSGARFELQRSILPASTVDQVRQVSGVKAAAPLGQLTVTVQPANGQDQIDATILAIDPSSFLEPTVTQGTALNAGSTNGVVVDNTFKRYGVKLNDRLLITPAKQALVVVGFTSGETYNHLPVIFTTIPFWQSVKFAAPGASGGVADPISAVAVQTGGGATAGRIATAVPGIQVASRAEAVQNLPGYTEESGSIDMMLGFLFVIAAFVLAVFFYVLTLQKTNQFGVLKAVGASTAFLVRDLLGQVMLLTTAGVVVGVALTLAVAAIIPANLPFALSNQLIVTYAGVMLLVGFGGSLLSLRRVSMIDPLIAIGRVD